MNNIWNIIAEYGISHLDSIEYAGKTALKIIVLFVIARFGIRILTKVADRALNLHGKMEERRKKTLISLFSNLIKYTVYFILLLTVLPLLDVEIGALLAGAGVVGITVAFGAQTLIKDFFNGFFILFEDQFGVGDQVEINNIAGQVHSVGLRVTSLKISTGEIVFIPNSQITQVTNLSKSNSIAVIDINVGYDTDVNKAIAILKEVMDEIKREDSNIVGEVSILGVQSLNDSNITLRATAECMPLTHWSVERLAKQRAHQAFASQKIDLPIQKIMYLHEKNS